MIFFFRVDLRNEVHHTIFKISNHLRPKLDELLLMSIRFLKINKALS